MRKMTTGFGLQKYLSNCKFCYILQVVKEVWGTPEALFPQNCGKICVWERNCLSSRTYSVLTPCDLSSKQSDTFMGVVCCKFWLSSWKNAKAWQFLPYCAPLRCYTPALLQLAVAKSSSCSVIRLFTIIEECKRQWKRTQAAWSLTRF